MPDPGFDPDRESEFELELEHYREAARWLEKDLVFQAWRLREAAQRTCERSSALRSQSLQLRAQGATRRLLRNSGVPSAPAPQPLPSEGDSLIVLLVEDDPAIREALSELLRDEGFTVACARDGLDALRSINQAQPAAILVDLMMPRMSGWELLERPEVTGIPSLVITAASLSPSDRQRLRAPVLEKPLNVPRLLAWVGEQVGS